MKSLKSSLFNMITAMLVVSICSATAIGYVYQLTEKPIAVSKKQKTLNAIKEMVGNFDNNPFEEKTLLSDGQTELYPARQDGIITAVAIKTYSKNGFGGKIELIVGISIDGTLNGYKIIEQNETPGLGSKITENKFKNQFYGLNAHNDNNLELSKDGGEIDAITGATISSRAVVEAVKKAMEAYNRFVGAQNE